MTSQVKSKRRYTRQTPQARLVNEAIRVLNDKPVVTVTYKKSEFVDEVIEHSIVVKWSDLA